MGNEEILKLIEAVIIIVSFLIGRYLLPKVKDDIKDAAAQLQVLLTYAESYVAYARQFLNCSGAEKMDNVVEKLKLICDEYGIIVDEETLRAIGQKAYDAMIRGEKSSKVIIENAVEELKAINDANNSTNNTEDPFEDDLK